MDHKWHLGYTPQTMPNGQGFDHSFGHMGGCIDNYSHFFYWQGPNRHDLWRNGEEIFEDGKFFPELMAAEAGKFIQQNKDKPFFMYFALNSPHYPYQGYAKWLKHYKNLPYPRNLYAAFLSTQDEAIGQLVGTVDRLGLRKNTIIIFQSDHGHSHDSLAMPGMPPLDTPGDGSGEAASTPSRSDVSHHDDVQTADEVYQWKR